jgi:hypothetical protein
MSLITLNSPDIRQFDCTIENQCITGTVTRYEHADIGAGIETFVVVATVVDVTYKFSITRVSKRSLWNTSPVAVYKNHGNNKIVSLDAFILCHQYVDQLFEMALIALASYKNHGIQQEVKQPTLMRFVQ